MASDFMADIGVMGAEAITAKKSTSRSGNTEMKMEDFLKLMVVQLQSQTIDDTADTGEMLNQLVQMQMVTALSNMTDASVMSYASSLVGKEVTIGYVDKDNKLHEEVLKVTGTGLYNGQQVIFCDDGSMYQLSQIMAVGHIPDELKKTGENDEKSELEKELNDKVDQTIEDIKNGKYDNVDGDNTGSGTDTGDAGEVGGVNGSDSSAESNNDSETDSNTETETDTDTGNETNYLEGMLVNPNPTDETYTGENGTPADGDE